ncbi:hypothetical protein ACFFX0_01190 [Citricoccus parietis]|uniref:Uncharacterized protein n=1 Tax=Citricoccus parietis TaxID=592307 RepID=A0ABV5FT71_9MICC
MSLRSSGPESKVVTGQPSRPASRRSSGARVRNWPVSSWSRTPSNSAVNRRASACSSPVIRSTRFAWERWASRRTASSPKIDSSSFCATTAVPPAIPTSMPSSPPVAAKETIIRVTATPFTPRAEIRAIVRLPAPSCSIRAIRSPCQPRISAAARSLKSAGSLAGSWPVTSARPAAS